MFLDNLDRLMKARKINKNILARESGIPYTTIDGFYKKGCDNVKLSTLVKIAAYFGVSLDYLINGEITTLSAHEKAVISAYRNNPGMQSAVDKLLGVEEEGADIAEDMCATIRAGAALPKSTAIK